MQRALKSPCRSRALFSNATVAVLHLCLVCITPAQAEQVATTPSVNTVHLQQKVPVMGYEGQPQYADPAGTYAGFTVCADCSGMSVRLVLNDDPGTQDHGSYRQTMMYLGAPTHSRHGKASRDQMLVESGTWKISPADARGTDRKLCLTTVSSGHDGSSADCYHVVHQTVLVNINGFEEEHQPDPFPAGLKTLLKQRRLSDGHEYPMLPVDSWSGFAAASAVPVR